LVIFDEPSNNIDHDGQKSIMVALERMSKTKVVILVTHDNSLFIRSDRTTIQYNHLDLSELQSAIFPNKVYPEELIIRPSCDNEPVEVFDDDPAEIV